MYVYCAFLKQPAPTLTAFFFAITRLFLVFGVFLVLGLFRGFRRYIWGRDFGVLGPYKARFHFGPEASKRDFLGCEILFLATRRHATALRPVWGSALQLGVGTVGGAGPGRCVPGDHLFARTFERCAGRRSTPILA